MLSLIIKELEANEISTSKSLWCILKVKLAQKTGQYCYNYCTVEDQSWYFSEYICRAIHYYTHQ